MKGDAFPVTVTVTQRGNGDFNVFKSPPTHNAISPLIGKKEDRQHDVFRYPRSQEDRSPISDFEFGKNESLESSSARLRTKPTSNGHKMPLTHNGLKGGPRDSTQWPTVSTHLTSVP